MSVNKSIFTMTVIAACCWASPVISADAIAGEQKAAACLGCHSPRGKSNNTEWPSLAGQQTSYLVNQLAAFKKGSRDNAIMKSMAANLNDDDMTNIATYFSSLEPIKAGGEPALAKAGQAKAPMCLGCHGASGEGNGQFPRLAGQHPEYLVKQLLSFKQGSRKNGPMQAIAVNLSEEDIKQLANYFGSL